MDSEDTSTSLPNSRLVCLRSFVARAHRPTQPIELNGVPARRPILGRLIVALLFALAGGRTVHAQANYPTPYFFTGFSGTGQRGSTDGAANIAQFGGRTGLALDSAGNVYVADTGNQLIRKVSPNGTVVTLAGSPGASGSADGTGTAARFRDPRGVAVDASGNLFVTDQSNNTIRKVTPAGVVTTFAGQAGMQGLVDAVGTAARFNRPTGITLDGIGNLYVSDAGNHAIRKITPAGAVTTLAGGTNGEADGVGTAAQFNGNFGITFEPASGNLFVAETSGRIRRVTLAGVVTHFAGLTSGLSTTSVDGVGTAARFAFPISITADTRGNLFVADFFSHVIRKISPGAAVTTIAGLAGTAGNVDGLGNQARFSSPANIAADSRGNLFVGDEDNFRIRRSVAPPAITITPDVWVTAGGGAVFSAVIASDYPVSGLQWRKNGVAIAGATASNLTLNNVQPSDAGIYTIAATNVAGTSVSAGSTLTVLVAPVITSHPVSQTVTVGAAVQFSVTATPSTGPTYQWRKNGFAINGATAATYAIPSATLGDAGNYDALVTNTGISVVSSTATLTVNVPVNTQAVTHMVTVGSPVQMNLSGSVPAGTTFQWRKNGVAIPGATTSALAIGSAALTDAGDYTLVFTTGGTSTTSNTVTLIVVPVPVPVITGQPTSQTVTTGVRVQFNVLYSSPVAVSFQWRKNGVPINGATSDFYAFNNAQPADSGIYSVALTNPGGTVTSTNATLTVSPPAASAPVITAHPVDQTITPGETAVFNVSVSGAAPFTFQWMKNGTPLPGATSNVLAVANAQVTHAGSYAVTVGNTAGLVVSDAALLNINAPPVVVAAPASQRIPLGSSVSLTATFAGSGTLTYQWYKNGAALSGATGTSLSIVAAQPGDAGDYTVAAANAFGSVSSPAATLLVTPNSRLSNLSIRTMLAAGQTAIIGISVEGGGPRDVLVRAIGPSLAPFGVTGANPDPRLDLFRGQTLVFSNEDWPASLQSVFASAGAFGLAPASRDAAFTQPLNGPYSIHARGTAAGVVLVEAYDLGDGYAPRLVNVSARNRVGTGDDILIAGFTVTGTGPKQLLIRAVGPGLIPLGVTAVLNDPTLAVFNAAGARVVENDNWLPVLQPIFDTVGAFRLPATSRDAAILATVAPGSYSVQVRGADRGTGEAVVEIYEVP